MKKAVLALLLGAAVAASASDQPVKPSTSQTSASQAGVPGIQTPFKVWVDSGWIFVDNYGTTDWTAALDVWATCTPVAPTTTCGSKYVNGKYHVAHYDKGQFPKGHGVAPVKGSANVQQTSGAGWVALSLALPTGTFNVVASAANNFSPQTQVAIAPPPGSNTIQLQPGAIQLAPTKAPTRP